MLFWLGAGIFCSSFSPFLTLADRFELHSIFYEASVMLAEISMETVL